MWDSNLEKVDKKDEELYPLNGKEMWLDWQDITED
jgi:hypothetical protein